MFNKRWFPLAVLLLLLMAACGKSRLRVPEEFLQPDEMVDLLVDIHLVDGTLYRAPLIREEKEDSAFNQYAAILSKYKLTRTHFDSTIHFYTQYPDDFAKIYSEVLKKLSVMEEEIKQKREATTDWDDE